MRKLIITVSTEDLDAALADLVDTLSEYGPEPAPHVRKKIEREISRIAEILSDCIDFESVDDEHT